LKKDQKRKITGSEVEMRPGGRQERGKRKKRMGKDEHKWKKMKRLLKKMEM